MADARVWSELKFVVTYIIYIKLPVTASLWILILRLIPYPGITPVNILYSIPPIDCVIHTSKIRHLEGTQCYIFTLGLNDWVDACIFCVTY